jgi:prolyl-tRNA editing enzyme YbaK/EbsC (Cys-tRNA(Pro) deacylase)
MNEVRTPADLARYIEEQQIDAQLVSLAQETTTVAMAAGALGCGEDQIVKSVLFLIRTGAELRPALVISNGSAPQDSRKLADAWEVGRKRIKLALPDVVLTVTGYPAGGVPPFGYPVAVDTYIDKDVLQQTVVYAGGGDERTLLRVAPQELLRVTRAQVIDAR